MEPVLGDHSRSRRDLEDRQRDGVLPDDAQVRRVSVADLAHLDAARCGAKAQLARGRRVTFDDQDAAGGRRGGPRPRRGVALRHDEHARFGLRPRPQAEAAEQHRPGLRVPPRDMEAGHRQDVRGLERGRDGQQQRQGAEVPRAAAHLHVPEHAGPCPHAVAAAATACRKARQRVTMRVAALPSPNGLAALAMAW